SYSAPGCDHTARPSFLHDALPIYPQPDLYTVEPVDLEWKFSEATGEAYLGVKRRGEDVDSSMIVMHEGKPVYLRFVDPALRDARSEEHTSELQSRENLVCRLLREK